MSLNRSYLQFNVKLFVVFLFLFISSCNPFQSTSSITELRSVIDQLSISSISPSSSFILGGTTITIKGSGFKADTIVTVGSTSCSSISIINSSELTCVLPSVSAPVAVDVSITTTSGVTTLNLAVQYTLDSFNSIELFSGDLSYGGSTDGTSITAKLNRPSKPIVYGSDIYIADTDNHLIRKFDTLTGVVTTVIGRVAVSGTTDGVGTNARLNLPMGMTLVGPDIYFVENGSCLIRKFNIATYLVTTIAGTPNNCAGSISDANGLSATFNNPVSIISDGTYLYIGSESGEIRRVSLSGTNTADSLTLDTSISAPIDFALIGQNLYFVEANGATSTLRKVNLAQTPPLTLNTVISLPTRSGGLTTDGTDIYVSGLGTHVIKKYSVAMSTLTTIVGTGTAGNTDATGTSASVHSPGFMDYSSGYIYLTSFGSHNLKKINLANMSVSTIMGSRK